jgi:hypothetical protein
MYKFAIPLSLLLLGGCTSVYYPPGTTPPVPVEDISTRAPGAQTAPVGPPAPAAGSGVTVNPAIITAPPPRPAGPTQPSAPASPLDDDIRAAMQGGDFERAAALTERALRIRPREATLWQTLATIRFNQGRVADAQGHAQRALSFSTDPNQRREIEALLTQIGARR